MNDLTLDDFQTNDNLQKAFGNKPSLSDLLEKGKALPIGTIKKRPNGNFIKTASGWKYHSAANKQSKPQAAAAGDSNAIKVGDTVTLNSDVNLVSFMDIKGKDLKVKQIKKVEMASGPREFYIVEHKGKQYEINKDYVSKSSQSKQGSSKDKKTKESFQSQPIKVGDTFNYEFSNGWAWVKVDQIKSNKVVLRQSLFNGDLGRPFEVSKERAQRHKDLKGKKQFEQDQKHNKVVADISKQLGLGKVKGGDLNSFKVRKELKQSLDKLQQVGNQYNVNSRSVGAGGFSGANSATMTSHQSGNAVTVDYNGTHHGSYYEGNTSFLVQIKVGGALDLNTSKALLQVGRELLDKFDFESNYGQARIKQTSGTAWSSVMLTAPSQNSRRNIIALDNI